MITIPKLDSKTAQRVQDGATNAGEGSEFKLLDEGVYRLQLRSVTTTILEKSKEPKLVGCPMWKWEFEIPEGEDNSSRRFWTQRILPKDNGYEHADFMMLKFAEPFEALGATPDVDTDELLGKRCRGFVTQRVIEKGQKAGETTNSLEDLMSDGETTKAAAAADDDYDF